MLCELQLAVEDKCPQVFIARCLVHSSPSEAFYPGRHLLVSELCKSAAYSILVYVASSVVELLVLLLENLQLVLIASFVHHSYVSYKECLVWQLH